VLVNRVVYHLHDPHIGDIVVFHPPQGADGGGRCGVKIRKKEQVHGRVRIVRRSPNDVGAACPRPVPQESSTNFIKRIVAGPGDRLRIAHGEPIVNGVKAKEDFINPCGGGGDCNFPKQITIPDGMYFMMGDNRGRSDDSRFWGPVPKSWIIGEAFLTYWPPDRIGFL